MKEPQEEPPFRINLNKPGIPALPYQGSSGWSGSDTSKERADRMDSSGATEHIQSQVLDVLYKHGLYGATWFEVDTELGIHHHGSSTGALSDLHKDGHIARLSERRGKSKVYVHLDFVNGRPTEKQGRGKKTPQNQLAVDVILMLDSVIQAVNSADFCYECGLKEQIMAILKDKK